MGHGNSLRLFKCKVKRVSTSRDYFFYESYEYFKKNESTTQSSALKSLLSSEQSSRQDNFKPYLRWRTLNLSNNSELEPCRADSFFLHGPFWESHNILCMYV